MNIKDLQKQLKVMNNLKKNNNYEKYINVEKFNQNFVKKKE